VSYAHAWSSKSFLLVFHNSLKSFLTCRHYYIGPFTKNLIISTSHPRAAEIEELKIDFSPSRYIFNGIGENFPNLKHLEIDYQNFEKLERKNFAGLGNLEKLTIDNNKFGSISEDAFQELRNLKTLYMYDNEFKEFPSKIFANLKNLKVIKSLNQKATTDNIDFSEIPDVILYNETMFAYYQNGEKKEA
jgi:Leucine-rich repeat (LRR) protein